MPIITTLTVISMLRGGDGKDLPFSDAEVLRGLLKDALAEEVDGVLSEALAIADDLGASLNHYRSNAESSLDAYIEQSSKKYTSTAELIEHLKQLDRERRQALQKMIQLRQALFELLSGAQWQAVFN
jgi:hypothetical protein